MKRFHIHIGVKNLEQSVAFYSTLFGQKPSKLKADYAKWLLDDPRVNFAISTRSPETGVNHLGIQVDSAEELSEITARLKDAEMAIFDEGETTCCYSRSNKAWVADPSGVVWEAYQNMADAEVYSGGDAGSEEDNDSSCCVPQESGASSCC